MEPGEDPLPLAAERLALSSRGDIVTLEAWSDTRNLSRRVLGIKFERRGRLELTVAHFGGRRGALVLVDLADPSNRDAERRGARLKYRERFRTSLARQFPEWRLVELTTEADLQHSLSPNFPRAFLRKGTAGLAAIGAAEDSGSPEAALSFGLIWLDYLRRRETGIRVQALVIFVPAGTEATTCHRVRYLNPKAAPCLVFAHDPTGQEQAVDPAEYTNFDTRLDPRRQSLAGSPLEILEWVESIAGVPGVERRELADGSVALAVRGLEFARASGTTLNFGLDERIEARSPSHLKEIERLARGLARMRCADASDRLNPLYLQHPEAWLESQVRASIESLDATLYPEPVYGQVPQFAAGERSVMDLLAVDRSGRLTVIEVKADQDIHLPLQALDYWMRVKWHLDRGEFSGSGYFPGIPLANTPPRLILVAPALEYHPSNATLLQYLAPEIPVERVGIGIEWRREFKVMFRVPSAPCPQQSSAK